MRGPGSVRSVNLEFHDFDPGRFVTGVKAGVLVPYSLSGTEEEVEEAARRYDREFLDWQDRWTAQSKQKQTGMGHLPLMDADGKRIDEPDEIEAPASVEKANAVEREQHDGEAKVRQPNSDGTGEVRPDNTPEEKEQARKLPENIRPPFVLDLRKVELESA